VEVTGVEFGKLAKELADTREAWYALNRHLEFRGRKTVIGARRDTQEFVAPVPISIGNFDHETGEPVVSGSCIVVRGHRLSALLREEIEWLENELKTIVAKKDITL
jgi:hypothetical protein